MARSAKLDILRAVSVVLVLGRHFTLPLAGAPSIIAIWQRGGWVGVDLFFVLSGFLVAGLLFREHQRTGTVRPGRFLLRRGLKIYPAFWVFMAATTLLWRDHVYPGALLSELLFFQNYGAVIWIHTWSLAVEEHFYLLLVQLFTWFVVFNPRRPFTYLPALFLLIAIGDLWWRSVTTNPDFARRFTPTHLRMDALFCGVTISYLYHYQREHFVSWATRWRVLLAIVGPLLLIPPFVWAIETTPRLLSLGLTGVYLGASALLIIALTLPEPTSAIWRGVAYVGSHSYSIYLWHLGVYVWIVPRLPLTWLSATMASVVLSILIGIAMAKAIEFPLLRLRDRFWPADTTALNSTPHAVVAAH